MTFIVSIHAIERYAERAPCELKRRVDWERVEAKILAMARRGKECWPARFRVKGLRQKYGSGAIYLRHGGWVAVVQHGHRICTVYPWHGKRWIKERPPL